VEPIIIADETMPIVIEPSFVTIHLPSLTEMSLEFNNEQVPITISDDTLQINMKPKTVASALLDSNDSMPMPPSFYPDDCISFCTSEINYPVDCVMPLNNTTKLIEELCNLPSTMYISTQLPTVDYESPKSPDIQPETTIYNAICNYVVPVNTTSSFDKLFTSFPRVDAHYHKPLMYYL
jgi:hypothetical protein